MHRCHRCAGMLLIVIVGLAAILLSLSVGFLARMRTDARESDFVISEAQARIMLHAAMNYIQETARLGWHDPDDLEYTSPTGRRFRIMRETYGWTDIRGAVATRYANGTVIPDTIRSDPTRQWELSIGPIDQFGQRVWTEGGPWPAPGSAVRCPMFAHQRPPFAIEDRRVANPLTQDTIENSTNASGDLDDERTHELDYAMDQVPVMPVAAEWGDFARPDAAAMTPVVTTLDLAWFRVYREPPAMHNGVNDYPSDPPPADAPSDYFDVIDLAADPANDEHGHHGIFIITCGAGGSLGFRDWDEVEDTYPSATDRPFDRATYERLRAEERLLWYRVEWSAAVLPGNHSFNAESGDLNQGDTVDANDHFRHPRDDSKWWGEDGEHKESEVSLGRMSPGVAIAGAGNAAMEGSSISRNPVGTIQWIMRLEREPPEW